MYLFKLYIKVIWYNKALLIGYLLTLASIILLINKNKLGISTITIGPSIIFACMAGKYTIITYLWAKREIEYLGYEKAIKHINKCFTYHYCNRVGKKWAITEYKRHQKELKKLHQIDH